MMILFSEWIWIPVVLLAVAWFATRGLKVLVKPVSYDYGNEKEDLPEFKTTSPDDTSIVTIAYRNKNTGKYIARVSCPHLDKHNWVEARSKDELSKEIGKVYERHSRECREVGL
jgi:hypothetical protein